MDVVTIAGPKFDQHIITIQGCRGDCNLNQDCCLFGEAAKVLREKNAQIVSQHVFCSSKHHEKALESLKKQCGEIDWPVTWTDAAGDTKFGTGGTQLTAISGVPIKRIRNNGRTVGTVFEDDDARYCVLGGKRSALTAATFPEQARESLENIENTLKQADMDFLDVIRTWFYNDDILSWYDEFNVVRTQFFNERGVFKKMVPSSTGVGVANPMGSALVVEALAIKPKTDKIKIQVIPSPLQCPAIDYKSSFSRATEVALPTHRILYISGTASIAPGGETVHLDDTKKQVELTMEVVIAILKSRGMDWKNVTKAIAYFKDPKDAPLFAEYCKEFGLPNMPVVLAHCDICRHDLLFEIELEAAIAEK